MTVGMTEVTTTLCKRAKGLGFGTIVSAMDFSSIGSYIREEVDAYITERGLDRVPHIFMATHSWGGREWDVTDGREPAFFEEEGTGGGGWYIFREEDVDYLFCSSAKSASSLVGERQEDGTWNLQLEVPIQEDGPYKGLYWRAFHRALGVSDEAPKQEVLTPTKELEESPEGPLAGWERELPA